MNRNITAIILVILAIGIYFTVTRGIIDDAQAIRTINSQYSDAIASAVRLVSVRDKVLADYKSISDSDRDRLTKMLPPAVDNIRLVIDLNNIAVQHGFTLKGITATADSAVAGAPGKTPLTTGGGTVPLSTYTNGPAAIPTPQLSSITVTFGLTAPYSQFQSFLQDLESNLRLMDVSQLSLTAADNGLYDWSVTLKTYYLHSQ